MAIPLLKKKVIKKRVKQFKRHQSDRRITVKVLFFYFLKPLFCIKLYWVIVKKARLFMGWQKNWILLGFLCSRGKMMRVIVAPVLICIQFIGFARWWLTHCFWSFLNNNIKLYICVVLAFLFDAKLVYWVVKRTCDDAYPPILEGSTMNTIHALPSDLIACLIILWGFGFPNFICIVIWFKGLSV